MGVASVYMAHDAYLHAVASEGEEDEVGGACSQEQEVRMRPSSARSAQRADVMPFRMHEDRTTLVNRRKGTTQTVRKRDHS